MATYAIGDIQGCAAEFEALLAEVGFDERRDALWLLGDLINRGPHSLAVMERVMALEDRTTVILGNHELHFLAIWFGGHGPNSADTFDDLLTAPQAEEVAQWLRRQPFLHWDRALGYAMVHAGIPPGWSLAAAAAAAEELLPVLQGPDFRHYFRHLYGNEPDRLTDDLRGMARWRILTNCFTRMRLVDDQGRLNFSHKGRLADAPPGWRPWFEQAAAALDGECLLFGHWAALEGYTGVDNLIALDTGCVWGRRLTALCLESGEQISVPALCGDG